MWSKMFTAGKKKKLKASAKRRWKVSLSAFQTRGAAAVDTEHIAVLVTGFIALWADYYPSA